MLPEVCLERKEAVRAYFAPYARFRVRAAAGLSALLVSALAARSPLMGSKRFFLTGYRLGFLAFAGCSLPESSRPTGTAGFENRRPLPRKLK
jgi:hypothetical protein